MAILSELTRSRKWICSKAFAETAKILRNADCSLNGLRNLLLILHASPAWPEFRTSTDFPKAGNFTERKQQREMSFGSSQPTGNSIAALPVDLPVCQLGGRGRI